MIVLVLNQLRVWIYNPVTAVKTWWACCASWFQPCHCPGDVKAKLLDTLTEALYYDEIAIGFTRMQTECKDFIASLKQQGVNMDQIIQPGYGDLDVFDILACLFICVPQEEMLRVLIRQVSDCMFFCPVCPMNIASLCHSFHCCCQG